MARKVRAPAEAHPGCNWRAWHIATARRKAQNQAVQLPTRRRRCSMRTGAGANAARSTDKRAGAATEAEQLQNHGGSSSSASSSESESESESESGSEDERTHTGQHLGESSVVTVLDKQLEPPKVAELPLSMIVCQGTGCRKRGNTDATVQELRDAIAHVSSDGDVQSCSCMGQCKHGPVVSLNGHMMHTSEAHASVLYGKQ